MHTDSNFICLVVWFVMLVVVVGGSGASFYWFHLEHVLAEWGAVAKEFGLRPQHEKQGMAAILAAHRGPLCYSGQYAGFDVRVTRHVRTISISVQASIGARSGIPASVGFRRRDERDSFGGNAYRSEFVVGDPAFDSRISVRGAEPVLRALADAPTRAKILSLFWAAEQAYIMYGGLCYETEYSDVSTAIERLLVGGIELARALRMEHAQVPSQLVANARSADLAEIRIAALEALSKLPDAQERARETTLALLDDPNPAVRARIAVRLGAADIDRLLARAERERNPRVLVALLGHLAKFAGARLRPLILEALRSNDNAVLRAAGGAAAATGLSDVAVEIARSFESRLVRADPATLVSLIRALLVLREPATEPALVRFLAHESRDVQRAVADALAEFGSASSVEALLERRQWNTYYDTDIALRTAVARIQARIGGARIGALSLAQHGDETGALSLVTQGDEGGALSLLPDTTERAVP